ncbi:MAG: outer membrane beta-barrel protein [Thermodesulfobacteriota bacterium]
MLLASVVVLALTPADVSAEEAEQPLTLQLMVGEMVISNDDPQVSGGDYTITLFGAGAQQSFFGGNLAQAGIETGLLLNWKSETRDVSVSGGGGGGSLAVSVDINQFLFDYYFGAYGSIRPIKWLRLYVGAGPLLIYGQRETEETDPATAQVETKSESGFSAGVYGRGGIDFVFTENFMLGAGARATRTGLSFNDAAGKIEVEGWQYFGVMTFRF